MQKEILRFLTHSGEYLGLPAKSVAMVVDELLDRQWVRVLSRSTAPFAARAQTPAPCYQQHQTT